MERMPMVYVMVALPRSGKSTYVRNRFSDTVKVSADQLRLLIHRRRYWARGEPIVWRIREIMLRALMEQQLDLVIDETNITKRKRQRIIKLAREYGYRAVAIVVLTEKETCKQRAVLTGQEDLIPVIEKMAERYEEVSTDEGFAEVIVVRGE